MSRGYFSRLKESTSTRVWINNPTETEVTLALAQGAIGCTTNPQYVSGLLKRCPAQVRRVVADVVGRSRDGGVTELAERVQTALVRPVVERFRPLFDATRGTAGFVSVQGPPVADSDGESICECASRTRAIGPNAVPKIPATLPGLVAFERVVEAGWPVIVTEVFSLDQLAVVCERYLRVTARTRVRPPFVVCPITGILGDHLKKVAQREGLDVPTRELEVAGVYLARRCAALVAERDYPVTLLFGGARTAQDLTGLIGGGHQATINWATFAEILAMDPLIGETISSPPESAVVERLLEEFSDFRDGWELGRLSPELFEEFGPVQHFRGNFMSGWKLLEAEVEATLEGQRIGGP